MKTKPGAENRLREMMAEFEQLKVPGAKGTIVYRSDADPNEFFLAVVFESKEAYRANAASPEQSERYRGYRDLLTADPEWHDGEIVYSSV
jgi:heme-degrading monooxygenase HmoA